jgi:hypothetical protein
MRCDAELSLYGLVSAVNKRRQKSVQIVHLKHVHIQERNAPFHSLFLKE